MHQTDDDLHALRRALGEGDAASGDPVRSAKHATRALSEAGADTAVSVRIEELGPTISLTLSLPFLWVGASEAQASLRAVHLPTDRVLLDAHVRRVRGGPFELRPARWAEPELDAALRTLLDAQAGS